MKKESLFDRDLRIRVFNVGWFFYMILTVLFLFLLSFFGKNLMEEEKRRLILALSTLEYVVLRLYKYSLKDIREDYNWYNEWPCYLCNQSSILCIAACFVKSDFIMSYLVSGGVFGALLALLMPDRYNKDQLFYSRQALGFYGYHCLLIVTCLSFYFLGLYQPEYVHALYVMAMIFFLACLAHVINTLLRKSGKNTKANYVFTYEPDNVIFALCYRYFPVKLFYMVPVLPFFGLAAVLEFFIMKLFG